MISLKYIYIYIYKKTGADVGWVKRAKATKVLAKLYKGKKTDNCLCGKMVVCMYKRRQGTDEIMMNKEMENVFIFIADYIILL